MDDKALKQKYMSRINSLNNKQNSIIDSFKTDADLFSRQTKVLENTSTILDDLDKEFCEKTKLTTNDVSILFLAIGLQIARQYIITNDKYRVSAIKGDEIMDKSLSLAPPDWKNILTQSVPYDAIKTSTHVSETGLAGTTHRYRTLGHDPIFGWIFGTANIMTNSLTKTNFVTYQVKDMCIIRHYPLGVNGMINNAVRYAGEDYKLLAVSVARQAVHFGSDYFTKQGLPVPLVSILNDDLAKDMLMKWNVDAYSITRGASMSIFINYLISFIHRLFYDGETNSVQNQKLYEVRTRKILSYSNLVASSSNLAIVAITKDFKKLDVGGLGVTIYRLITDKKFIREVKEEFIFGQYKDIFINGNI